MKNGLSVAAALAAALFTCIPAAVCAEPVETSLSVTLNALSGRHEINDGQSNRVTFAPLPLVELAVRSGGETLRVEGLPPINIRFNTTGSGGAQTSQVSILNATFRHTFAGGWFAGAGQTVYNQFTGNALVNGGNTGRGDQYSRVTGARLEAGRTVAMRHDHVDYTVAVNPKMHGIQYTRLPFGSQLFTFADPESAAQVDLAVRVAHELSKHGELLYGLRYLNYTARYDDAPGQLADRNVGFAPVVGFRVRF